MNASLWGRPIDVHAKTSDGVRMVRPRKPRCGLQCPTATYFKPRGIPLSELEEQSLRLDELEAMRLVDLEGLSQDEAGAQMGVSRATIGRLAEAGRKKVIDCLVNSKALRIESDDEPSS